MASAWGDSWGASWGDSWGAVVAPTTPGREGLGGDDVPRRSPHKGWNREEWAARVKAPNDALEATLRETYAALTGADATLAVLSRVDAIVRPVARADIPLRINWGRLAREYERTNALIKLWQEEMDLRAAIEEEDDILVLLQ